MGKINKSSQKVFDSLLESNMKDDDKRISKASESITGGGKESGKEIDTKDKMGLSDEAMEERKAK